MGIGVVGVLLLKRGVSNKVITDSYKLIELNWKSPHTSQVVQILSPGNSGNVIQDIGTGIIYLSQNAAAKALNVDQGNISRQLAGKLPDVNGHRFKKLIDGVTSRELQPL